ncbi:hypothetical protein KIN20_033413 [Parelaphostrongylus tenuis]|uniref:Uncharacterized protein n=1 Tax=Parelaphostrongylus tenuis TaxID=148309 RepID=A0AAD5R830_PARTN|nr:hypothetical protein KIN20_033413 [Parelaphostrongylus tenuis]
MAPKGASRLYSGLSTDNSRANKGHRQRPFVTGHSTKPKYVCSPPVPDPFTIRAVSSALSVGLFSSISSTFPTMEMCSVVDTTPNKSSLDVHGATSSYLAKNVLKPRDERGTTTTFCAQIAPRSWEVRNICKGITSPFA